MQRTIVLAAIVVAAIVAFFLLRGSDKTPEKVPAATPPSSQEQLKMTGNYAEDWMTQCGPLKGSEQADCTSRLDALYGRSAGAPVPPASGR